MLIEIANAKRAVKNFKKAINKNRDPSDGELSGENLEEYVRVKKK